MCPPTLWLQEVKNPFSAPPLVIPLYRLERGPLCRTQTFGGLCPAGALGEQQRAPPGTACLDPRTSCVEIVPSQSCLACGFPVGLLVSGDGELPLLPAAWSVSDPEGLPLFPHLCGLSCGSRASLLWGLPSA